jgi:hypothetical protein
MFTGSALKHLWFEILLDGNSGSYPAQGAFSFSGLKFSKFVNVVTNDYKTSSNTHANLQLNSSVNNKITGYTANNVGAMGLFLESSSYNTFRDLAFGKLTANGSDLAAVLLSSSSNNSFSAVRISEAGTSSTTYNGLRIDSSSNNVFNKINVSNIYNDGLNEYGNGLFFGTGTSSGNIFTQLISSGHDNAGLLFNVSTAASNIFAFSTFASNKWQGVAFNANASSNLFSNTLFFNNKAASFDAGTFSPTTANVAHNTASASADTAGPSVFSSSGASGALSFTGYLIKESLASCLTGSNLGGSCNAAGLSTYDRNLATSLNGKVTSDGVNSQENGSGLASFSAITEWINFENFFRNWGKNHSDGLLSANLAGRCASGGTCQIYDFRVSASDSVIRNRSGDGNNANTAFAVGSACPSAVAGSRFLSKGGLNFLENAIEILDDSVGNDNGLCESSEACIYAPHIGAYQGEGTLSAGSCTFSPGTVTGVLMYAWGTNGGI